MFRIFVTRDDAFGDEFKHVFNVSKLRKLEFVTKVKTNGDKGVN